MQEQEDNISNAYKLAAQAGNELLERLNEEDSTRLLSDAQMENYTDNQVPLESMITVDHKGSLLYPAFQINPDSRKLRDWVPTLLEVFEDRELNGRDFTLWAVIPSLRFGGDAPIDHVGDNDFLRKAAASFAPL